MNNKFVLKKRGKYLRWRNYATGVGSSFVWTDDINGAQIFCSKDCLGYTSETKGKSIPIIIREE